LTNIIAGVNAELLEKWRLAARRRETVNVTQDVSSMVLKLTLVAIFGDDYATVAPHFNILAGESARDFEFAAAFRPLSKIIVEIAAQRRRDNTIAADFLGRLMEARDRERGEPMPDAQLAREVMTLVVAGHETTAGLLNWMWYLLSRHPESQIRLSDELDRLPWAEAPAMDALPKYAYTRQVIDEALRLYPPLWLMTRKALDDDQLGEFFVPAGTEI
jgi:cytochrome P450